MWVATVLFLLLLGLLAYLDTRKPKNFPPGPSWLPILGSALVIERMRKSKGSLCRAATSLAREYGDGKLVGLRVGQDVQVALTSHEAIREMATKPEFDGRPTGLFFKYRTWGVRRGILLTDGELWREQRRFMVRHLRDFGLGRTSAMESIITKEVASLVELFRTTISNAPGGVAVLPLHDAFGISMLNSVWAMLAGIRYEPDDVEVRKLQHILSDMFASMDMAGCLFNHFPLLRFIAPEASGYVKYMETHRNLWNFLHEELLRHKANHVPGVNKDFMDVYLEHLKDKDMGEEETFFSELQLLAICLDLFMAGSDTTNKSLSFAFMYLIREPRVQKRAQEEMDAVLGRESPPTLADRPRLPYMEAVVSEAIRVFAGNSFGLPHRTLKDTTLLGYNIPKDTTVLIDFNGFLFNEDLWGDPYNFRPERFLGPNDELVYPEWFIPFGMGHRRCIGDTLAKTNIFLFISNLLYTFNFKVPDGMSLPDAFPVDGITPSVQPFEGEITLRV